MGMTQCLGLQSLVFPQRMEGKSYDSRHLFNLGSCFSFFSGHQPLVLNLPSYLSVLQATAEVADNGDWVADKILPLVQ